MPILPALSALTLFAVLSAPPRLAIEPPGLVDLGSAGPLERRDQTYRFRNTSAAPIALRVLDLAPGVTLRGPALQGPIAPGAGAALTLSFDPSGWQGVQNRNVRLGTDDPGQGAYYLPVQVLVRPDLTVDGVRREFGDVADYESPEQVFTFTRETGLPLALRLAAVPPPHLEADLRPRGAGATLSFILRPDRVPAGERLGLDVVRVETNAPLQPAFDLYLAWRIHPAVDAEPPRVVFQDPERGVAELRLTAHDGRPFRVLEARVEGGGFQVEAPPAPAAVQVLTIRRTAREAARALLVLRFQGQERELRVPLAYLPSTPLRSCAPGPRPAAGSPRASGGA